MNALLDADVAGTSVAKDAAGAWPPPAVPALVRCVPIATRRLAPLPVTRRDYPASYHLPIQLRSTPSAALAAAGAALTGSAVALAFFLSRKPAGTPHGPSHVKLRA